MEEELEKTLLWRHGPDIKGLETRNRVLRLVKETIVDTFPGLSIKSLEYGSFPLRTFLKTGDIDMTLILPSNPYLQVSSIILAALKHKFEYLTSANPNIFIEYISLINAKVPILKLKINEISVDISINQLKGVHLVKLFEDINKLTPCNLFKKSILIAKIWGTYYSRVLGSMYGGLTTYALEVLVLFVINTIPQCRSSPISVLKHLIEFFSDFDWESNVITFCKVLSVSEYISILAHKSELYKGPKELVLTPEMLSEHKNKFYINDEVKLMPLRNINIVDPLESSNNLGRSVFNSIHRIKSAFKASAEILATGVNHLFCINDTPVPQVVLEKDLVIDKHYTIEPLDKDIDDIKEDFKQTFRVLLENTHKTRIKTK
jgi:hypothetical protein